MLNFMSLGKVQSDLCSGFEFCLSVGLVIPGMYGYHDDTGSGDINPDNIAGIFIKGLTFDTASTECILYMGSAGNEQIFDVTEMEWEFDGFGSPVTFTWSAGAKAYVANNGALTTYISTKDGSTVGMNLEIDLALIPVMPDGAGLPYGKTTGTTYFDFNRLPHKAFDNNINTMWATSTSTPLPHILEYDGSGSELQNLGVAKGYTITFNSLTFGAGSAPKAWIVEALVLDVWTVVDTVTNEPAWGAGINTRFYPMDTQLEANGWRIVINTNYGGGSTSIVKLDIRGKFTTKVTKDILIPVMTSNNTPEGLAVASQFNGGAAWECLNRTRSDFSDAWISAGDALNTPPELLTYTNELTTTFTGKATSLQLANRHETTTNPNQETQDMPTTFTLEVSDDGITWNEVLSVVDHIYHDTIVASEFKIPLLNQVSGTNSYRLSVSETVAYPARKLVILSIFNIIGDLEVT